MCDVCVGWIEVWGVKFCAWVGVMWTRKWGVRVKMTFCTVWVRRGSIN